jgi:DEAD/H associated
MACGENVAGDREIPDHPLTNRTIADCLHEAMDIEGLERLLARLEAGEIDVVTRDLTQPSPLALEVEGFVLRGRFTSEGNDEEWCDRRLLARIHHYTVRRLRAEIEPVAARDFLRFLFDWQRVTDETRMEGPDAVQAAVALLEGFEAPAGAWETELLPTRIAGYEPAWLDDQCLAGRVSWARLTPVCRDNDRDRVAAPIRTTPITLLERRHTQLWSSLTAQTDGLHPGARAQTILDCLRSQGASFFDELAAATGLMRIHVEAALAELVTFGLVTSDSFGGLRALLVRNRLLFRDGLPVASLRGDDVQFLTDLDTATQWQARKALLRSASPALLADLA